MNSPGPPPYPGIFSHFRDALLTEHLLIMQLTDTHLETAHLTGETFSTDMLISQTGRLFFTSLQEIMQFTLPRSWTPKGTTSLSHTSTIRGQTLRPSVTLWVESSGSITTAVIC